MSLSLSIAFPLETWRNWSAIPDGDCAEVRKFQRLGRVVDAGIDFDVVAGETAFDEVPGVCVSSSSVRPDTLRAFCCIT